MAQVPSAHIELDGDQSAALARFVDDVNSVLATVTVSAEYLNRSIAGLSAAYRAALVTGRWGLLVAVLADALDDLHHRNYKIKARSSSYWRLRAIVEENADLLPPEMRSIPC